MYIKGRALWITAALTLTSTGLGLGSSRAEAQTTGGSTAVVTPLLRMLEFGDVVGLPLACGAAISAVSETTSQYGGSGAAAPFMNQVQSACTQLSQQGDGYLQEAISKSEALNFINPDLQPVLAAMAQADTSAGDTYSSSLSPFGPTIAGLGGTVAFFEGD